MGEIEVVAAAEQQKPGRRHNTDPESQGDQRGSARATAPLGRMLF